MLALLPLLVSLAAPVFAIPTISAKGSKLFTSDGNQFYIKGIAYQLTNGDPLVNTAQCKRDIALMQTLGTNSIRVYHVDANADHDGCMSAFADAGIYAWIDLDTFDTYILQSTVVGATPQWNSTQFHAFSAVMDTFQKYDNTAGFFVGNEVLTSGASSVAAPYVKAAAQDMKAYRDNSGYRDIPVGYSAADIPALRPNLQNYLACGDDANAAVDFYSLNAYEWCGDSSYTESGYDELQKNASHYNIPIFFSETGCIVPEPRLFTDQSAILGPDMENTWSGAIIYEWVQEVNNYGLTEYGPYDPGAAAGSAVIGGYTLQGTPTPIQPGFDNLSTQWATLSPTGISESAYTPSLKPPACPSYTAGFWEISGNVPLPTLNGVKSAARTTNAASSTPSSGSSSSSSNNAKTSKSSASTSNILSSTSRRASAHTTTSTGGAVKNVLHMLAPKHYLQTLLVGMVCAVLVPVALL